MFTCLCVILCCKRWKSLESETLPRRRTCHSLVIFGITGCCRSIEHSQGDTRSNLVITCQACDLPVTLTLTPKPWKTLSSSSNHSEEFTLYVKIRQAFQECGVPDFWMFDPVVILTFIFRSLVYLWPQLYVQLIFPQMVKFAVGFKAVVLNNKMTHE